MERARKMVLVSKEQFDRIQTVRQVPTQVVDPPAETGRVPVEVQTSERPDILQSTQTPGDNLTRLDNYMKQILDSKVYQDEHEKLKHYLQALRRYLFFIEEKRKPGAIAATETRTPYEISAFDDVILQSVPKTCQKKTKLLLDHLKVQRERINWDDNGVVYIDGQKIKNSNIVDLMNDAARQRKNSKPAGRREFAKILRETATPHEFVGNEEVWQLATGSFKGESDYFDVSDKSSFLENSENLTIRLPRLKGKRTEQNLHTSTPFAKKTKKSSWLSIK